MVKALRKSFTVADPNLDALLTALVRTLNSFEVSAGKRITEIEDIIEDLPVEPVAVGAILLESGGYLLLES